MWPLTLRGSFYWWDPIWQRVQSSKRYLTRPLGKPLEAKRHCLSQCFMSFWSQTLAVSNGREQKGLVNDTKKDSDPIAVHANYETIMKTNSEPSYDMNQSSRHWDLVCLLGQYVSEYQFLCSVAKTVTHDMINWYYSRWYISSHK